MAKKNAKKINQKKKNKEKKERRMDQISGEKLGFSIDSNLSDNRKLVSMNSKQRLVKETPINANDNCLVSVNQIGSVVLTDNNEENKRNQIANMKNDTEKIVRYRSSEKQLAKSLKKSVACLSVQKYGTVNPKIDSNTKKNYEVQNSKLKVF